MKRRYAAFIMLGWAITIVTYVAPSYNYLLRGSYKCTLGRRRENWASTKWMEMGEQHNTDPYADWHLPIKENHLGWHISFRVSVNDHYNNYLPLGFSVHTIEWEATASQGCSFLSQWFSLASGPCCSVAE